MGDSETRKLWVLVAKGSRKSDFEPASREKSQIEVFSVSACFNT